MKGNNLEYIKHNRKVTEILKELFESIKGTVKGLKGYAILENIENDKETIVLTFWDNRKDMKNYYSIDNNILYDPVNKVKPMCLSKCQKGQIIK